MACNRSSPNNSPRTTTNKYQQQSWEDCGTPPINVYDTAGATSPRSPNHRTSYYEPKSPKSPRNTGYYTETKSPKSSSRKFSYAEQRSPKFEYNNDEPPRSPKIIYSNGDCDDLSGMASSSVSASTSAYYSQSPSCAKSPKSPKKFVFDAVSPRDEHKICKPVDYYDSTTPDDDTFKFCSPPKNPITSNKYTSPPYTSKNKPHKQHNSGRHIQSTTVATDIDLHELYPSHKENKRSSIVTESTLSGDSGATSATTTTAPYTSMSDGDGGGGCGGNDPSGGRYNARGRRRHAINITSNPGYQAIHNSHSTLDRTCSDSIVSLRYRKSTSDLTDVTATATESNNNNTPVVTTHKRRASSKGGLAYLASRRNSRESMKSAASNASLFSNEDLGPLAFQASARGRTRRTSNFLELPIPDHIRPRVCSLPERPYNPRQSDDLYRLRTFSISKGTVVNCGDSIISRRSRSNTSVNSTNSRASERSPFDGSCCGGGYTNVDSLPPSPSDSEEPPPPPRYRVVMMGDAGVGKTALVSQFMTSEYMHTYDASLDYVHEQLYNIGEAGKSLTDKKKYNLPPYDEFGEKTVSILLDGEESEMIFIDHPSTEMSVENSLSTYEPHGCVVVYSVVQRNSFRQAEEIINYLWRENVTRDKAVILVGNKADLARSRLIPAAEGKSLAQSRDAKFIETSSGIQHNVDELLVGILKQIRLKESRAKKTAAHTALKMRNSKTHMSLHLAKEILQKICLSDITKSKSCENLHVL